MARQRESIRQFKHRLGFLRDGHLPVIEGRLIATHSLIFLVAQVAAFLFSIPTVPFALGSGSALIFAYFAALRLDRTRVIDDARLIALSARIRPHFLFNSLNAILGTIRADPRIAEDALESLSELFRALLQDPKELVSLSEELALCRQYLSLEKLRLGHRLRVRWDIDRCPPDAQIPPLVLQPLLENAVYHGIEPSPVPEEISIRLVSDGKIIAIELINPLSTTNQASSGNQIALQNIRDRLAILYGNSAVLTSEMRIDKYVTRIILPYRPDHQ